MTVIIILILVIFTESSTKPVDILILFLGFILPLLLISFSMLYFPNKYLTRYIFDVEKKLLSKIKMGSKTEKIDLVSVQSIVSKTIKTNPGIKYNLVFEGNDNNSRILLNEDTPFGSNHWIDFAERLSKITGLPLRNEYWVEDLNGNLSLIQNQDRIAAKKMGLLIIFVPLSLSFVAAMMYELFPTLKAFLLLGSAAVAVNIGLSFLFVLSIRKKTGKLADNNLTLSVSVLTLLIPYSFLYLFFVFAINGFRLPAGL